jgi:DNA polymerase (family 10)
VATNEEVAEQFDELGDRLLLEGESWFKVSAYRKAAATFRGISENVEAIAAEGHLRKLPGIGEAIASKVEAYLETGHIPALDRLQSAQPDGLLLLFRETGIAPRRLRMLAEGPLEIDSAEKLSNALDSGALESVTALDAPSRQALAKWRAARTD